MKAKKVIALMMAAALITTSGGVTTLADQVDNTAVGIETVVEEAEEDIKAEKVNYSIAADSTVYLTAGQEKTLKLYSGAEEISAKDWVVKKVVDGEETTTFTETVNETGGKVSITHAPGMSNVGNVYHVYPQVELTSGDANAKDANGNDLYYTVIYLGEVKVTAPEDAEVKVGTTPKFTVATVYGDADDELKKLVSENATLTYADATSPTQSVYDVDTKTGKITKKSTGNAAIKDKVAIKATCGSANATVNYYVVPAANPKVSSIKLDQTTVEVEVNDTVNVRADVLGANGKEAFNYMLDDNAANVKTSDATVATVAVTPAGGVNAGNTIKITGVKEGTATITVQSLTNPSKTATVTVNVKEAEPYKFNNTDKETFVTDGGTTEVTLAKDTHYAETNDSTLSVEYEGVVTAAYDVNGKAVADKDTVLKVTSTDKTAVKVKGGSTDGYAILKVTATAKSKTDDSVSYKHTVEYKVYNVTTGKAATKVVFSKSKLNDKGKEVINATGLTGNQYAVGDKFKLTAYGTNSGTGYDTDDTVINGYKAADYTATSTVVKAEMSGVTWKSSDPTKASVDENGNVEILALISGAAVKITATSVTDPSVYKEYEISTATDLSTVTLSSDLASGIVETTGGDVTFTTATDVASIATYDWSVSNSQYATLKPTLAPADVAPVKKGDQTKDAVLTADKVIKAVEPVTVTVTMTSRTTPSVKETKDLTIYIVPENYEKADIVEVKAADGTEIKDVVGLGAGDTYALKATVKGVADAKGVRKEATVQDVKWASSDESIATVDANGVVTAVAASEETVEITATAAANNAGAAIATTVTFTVSDIAVEAIETAQSVSVEAGSTKTVDVLLTNKDGSKKATNQAVTVASDNEAVATAKAADGKITVTGVAAGTANIVVTSAENKEVTATIPVTVTAAPVTPTNPTEVAVSAITLSQSSALLSAGKTVALAATVAPENATNKAVTWTSSDASVATVDANGVVTAVSAGKATITATAGTVSAACDVTVSSVKLNAKTVPLQVKKSTSALKATVSAKEDAVVSWKSSNTKVVKVNAKTGKLTATSKTGTAKITVTTKSGAKATCTVKVQKAKVTTKSIAFAKKSVSLKKGKSVKLTINRNPISATEKITWTSSNKKVATVDKNGKVTGKKAGKATITAKTSNGKKATCKVTVK